MRLKTPYKDLVPPLSSEEFSALKADIKANGQLQDILTDEDGNVLDGHHRVKILGAKSKTKIVRGLTEAEKEAFVFRSSNTRRNLSPEQKAEVRKRMRSTAKKLREENAKHWTQARVAAVLGVARNTVSVWFSTNVKHDKGSKKPKPKPDARVKLTADDKRDIVADIDSGRTQQQVAADYGVSQKTVSNIITKHEERIAEEAERKRLCDEAERAIKDFGVIHGDFIDVGDSLPDDSVDLIFTDPPYHREHVHLYYDVANIASRVLKPGGSLLAYCGHYLLPEIISSMAVEGMKFFWMCAVVHSGQKTRMNEYGVIVGWKPIVWFIREGKRRDNTVFVDDIVVGKREKEEHKWQQSVIEARYFIERLVPADGLVFDPFCGGGTTALAAQQCGRLFITCDIDAAAVAKSRKRLN